MKMTIRHWIGSADFCEREGSSLKGVLNYKGLPVGFRYYSHVTNHHHLMMASDCPNEILRHLKKRTYVTTNMLNSIIKLFNLSETKHGCSYVKDVNNFLDKIGSPKAYREGKDYFDLSDSEDAGASADLTYILYKTGRQFKYSYLVCSKSEQDTKNLNSTVAFKYLGYNWFGTRDLTEFILFKIGKCNSITIEIT